MLKFGKATYHRSCSRLPDFCHPSNSVHRIATLKCETILAKSMGRRTCSHGGFHGHGGTPSHHPFLNGIFHEINQPFWGSPILGNPIWIHMVCWWNRLMFKEEEKFKIWPLNQAIVVDMTWCDASILTTSSSSCSTGVRNCQRLRGKEWDYNRTEPIPPLVIIDSSF